MVYPPFTSSVAGYISLPVPAPSSSYWPVLLWSLPQLRHHSQSFLLASTGLPSFHLRHSWLNHSQSQPQATTGLPSFYLCYSWLHFIAGPSSKQQLLEPASAPICGLPPSHLCYSWLHFIAGPGSKRQLLEPASTLSNHWSTQHWPTLLSSLLQLVAL